MPLIVKQGGVSTLAEYMLCIESRKRDGKPFPVYVDSLGNKFIPSGGYSTLYIGCGLDPLAVANALADAIPKIQSPTHFENPVAVCNGLTVTFIQPNLTHTIVNPIEPAGRGLYVGDMPKDPAPVWYRWRIVPMNKYSLTQIDTSTIGSVVWDVDDCLVHPHGTIVPQIKRDDFRVSSRIIKHADVPSIETGTRNPLLLMLHGGATNNRSPCKSKRNELIVIPSNAYMSKNTACTKCAATLVDYGYAHDMNVPLCQWCIRGAGRGADPVIRIMSRLKSEDIKSPYADIADDVHDLRVVKTPGGDVYVGKRIVYVRNEECVLYSNIKSLDEAFPGMKFCVANVYA